MKQLVDLSHTIENGMITYPGLPGPVITDYLSRDDSKDHYADGTSFHIGKIEMVANTGTYLDAPSHRYEDGKDISDLDLHILAGLGGVVIRVEPGKRSIGPEAFSELNVRGKAVLVHTGWAKHWGTDTYFKEHPYLTRDAVELLKENHAILVGIDSLNIDDTNDGQRPAHSILLDAGIPVVEHLCNLEQLPDSGFQFHAVPVKVKNLGTFPVRAYASLSI